MDLNLKIKESFLGLSPIHQKIRSLLHTARIDIIQLLKIKGEIDAFETILKGPSTEFKTYEDFMNRFVIEYVEFVDISFLSTLCEICDEVCHENCDIGEFIMVNDQIVRQCWRIKNGGCRICTNKCSYISHYRALKTIKKSNKKIQDILNDIKIKYNHTFDEKHASSTTTMSKENVCMILESVLNKKVKEINELFIKLYQVCETSKFMQKLKMFIDQLDEEYTKLKSVSIGNQEFTVTSSLKDLLKTIRNESSLTKKVLLYTNADDMNHDKQTEENEEVHHLPSVGDEELNGLLFDIFIEKQKTSKLKISSKEKETSNRFILLQNKIKSLLHETRIEIFQILKLKTEIDTFINKSQASGIEFKTYEDFMDYYVIEHIEVLNTSFLNTLCQNCDEVCHEDCDIEEFIMINNEIIQQCLMIKDGNCCKCTNKCSHISHYRTQKTIKKSNKKIQDILNDIKIKYDYMSDENNTSSAIITNEDVFEILDNAFKNRVDAIKNLCIMSYEICPDYEMVLELLIFIKQLDKSLVTLSNDDINKQTNALIISLNDLHDTMLNNPHLLEKFLMNLTLNRRKSPEKIDENIQLNKTLEIIDENIRESTIAENNTINSTFASDLVTHKKNLDSTILPENIEETMETTQEIFDSSGIAKVLIIGETGAGKSTFINYLTNYFRHGNLENLHVAIPTKYHPEVTEKFIHCEMNVHNTTQSMTDSCNQYMFSTDSHQYLFVDTPGLSDTRGAQQDDKNIAKILDSIEDLGGLTAVIIVVNGAVSRLTINIRNVLTRLRGNLPDIIMDNIIIVLTNVTRYAANFSIDALQLNGNVYPYYMQNSAFSQNPATQTEVILEAMQYDFDQSMNEIKNMVNTINTFQTKSVDAFKTMKNIRGNIKTLFHKVHLEVSQIQTLQDEMNIYDNLVKQCDNNLMTYKDYTEEREIETADIVDTSIPSTLCGQCNQVCHENCQPNESTTTGSQLSNQCWVFKNGHCQICVNKCSYTTHYYAKKTIKKSKKKMQTILDDIKFKYDQAWNEKNTYQKKITSKEDAKKVLEIALKEKNEEIKQLCVELRDICAGFDFTLELNVFINQLETEETMLRSIEARQQSHLFIRSLKDLCNRMANDPDLSIKPISKMNIINTAPSSNIPIKRTSVDPTKLSTLNKQISSLPKNSVEYDSKPSSETDSFADNDILAVIRTLNRKKDNQAEESETESDKSDTDSDISIEDKYNTNESDNDEQDNLETQENTLESQSINIDNADPKTLSIDELISCYNLYKGHPQVNLIVFELVQRSLGKSTGPLNTPEALANFTTNTQKYSVLGVDELMQEYDKLKQNINSIIESDIFKINQVSPNVLSEIAVVHMLLQSSSFIPNFTFNINPHQTHQFVEMPYHYPNPNSYFPQQGNYDMPINHFQPYAHSLLNTTNNLADSDSQSHAHLSNVEYQSIQQSPSDSSFNLDNTTEREQQPDISIDSIQESSLNIEDQLSIHDKINSQSNPDDSSLNITTIDEKHNNIDKMSTIELISTYEDACAQDNQDLINLYYDELNRRCYRGHSTFIDENRTLFTELCQTYQNQKLEDLKENLLRIHQTIDSHLIDGSPASINNIPKELIVESAALYYLISNISSETQ